MTDVISFHLFSFFLLSVCVRSYELLKRYQFFVRGPKQFCSLNLFNHLKLCLDWSPFRSSQRDDALLRSSRNPKFWPRESAYEAQTTPTPHGECSDRRRTLGCTDDGMSPVGLGARWELPVKLRLGDFKRKTGFLEPPTSC